jgi:hypothetical protein
MLQHHFWCSVFGVWGLILKRSSRNSAKRERLPLSLAPLRISDLVLGKPRTTEF